MAALADGASPPEERTTVAIIGGGVAGLAACVALRDAGIPCLVFERDGSLEARRSGYGMTLSSDVRGPLGALGILDACRALDCRSAAHWVFDGRGRLRGYFGRGLRDDGPVSRGADAPRTGSLRVSRQELRAVLRARLPADAVRHGKTFAGYAESDGGAVATFEDGSRVACAALRVLRRT